MSLLGPFELFRMVHQGFYNVTGFVNNDLTLVNPNLSLKELSYKDAVYFKDEKKGQEKLYYIVGASLDQLKVRDTTTGLIYTINR